MRERPPKWILALCTRLLPEAERDFVLGDLEEGYRTRRGRWGRLGAAAWLVVEAMRTTTALATYDLDEGRGMMTGFDNDVRGALRIFRRTPGFAAVVVLTLAIGVGGATAVFSVLRGVVLSPLTFEDSERVVMLWGQTPAYARTPLTVGDYNALTEIESFSGVAASWSNRALLIGDGLPEQVSMGWVTPEYFDVVGVMPALGRALIPDDVWGILLSHDLWVRRWGADPDVVGRTVELPGGSFEIVGVLPADRDPNLTGFSGTRTDFDVWRLMPPDWTQGEDRSVGWLRATARLAGGVPRAQAQAEADALMTTVNETVTDRDGGTDLRINLIPVREDLVGGVARTLWILLGSVLGVLLIASANVANLMLGRGEARSGEVAVRAALGGSRLRLLRQLFVEGGVLALVGGALGVGVAWVGVEGLLALAPPGLPRLDTVAIDGGVLGFSLLATALSATVFAVVPALRATRSDLAAALGERTATGGAQGQRLSRGLVVAEVALSLALVVATGLLLRSVGGLSRVDLGFEPEDVITFSFEASGWGESAEEATAIMTSFIDRIEAMPGVQAAGVTNRVPLGGGLFTANHRSDDMAAADIEPQAVSIRYVTPGYFAAMGARLVTGRLLQSQDGMDAVVIDESTADQLWPGQNPLGRRIGVSWASDDEEWSEVVGVVASMKHASVAAPAEATLFLPMLPRAAQQNARYMTVRVAGDALGIVEPLRAAVREVDGNAVISNVRTMERLVRDDTAGTRFATALLVVFGAVALLLATVGLHGVMAYAVRRQRREIGIRVALGADHGEILRRAVRSGAWLVMAGIAVGAALALGFGRVLQSLLYEVAPNDVSTLIGAAVLIGVVGMLGSYFPARLVLGMDPAEVLREE